jgi:hypothetical protein
MPSIDYPSSPIAGQTSTYSNGNVVIFDGSVWRSTTTTLPTGTSNVNFGFNGFINDGLPYTLGTPLILNFINNNYGENSFTTTFVSDSNVISNSVITLMPSI